MMLIVIAACAALLVLYLAVQYVQERILVKQQKILSRRLTQIASMLNLRFSSQEYIGGNAMLGIDRIYRKVLYMYEESADKNASFVLIDLPQVHHCTVKTIHRMSYNQRKRYIPESYLDKILLRFEFVDGRLAEEISFYSHNKKKGFTAEAMYNKALLWEMMIRKMITGRPAYRRSAII